MVKAPVNELVEGVALVIITWPAAFSKTDKLLAMLII
jgi:hypothetical protein